jgi:hypothetical protein
VTCWRTGSPPIAVKITGTPTRSSPHCGQWIVGTGREGIALCQRGRSAGAPPCAAAQQVRPGDDMIDQIEHAARAIEQLEARFGGILRQDAADATTVASIAGA